MQLGAPCGPERGLASRDGRQACRGAAGVTDPCQANGGVGYAGHRSHDLLPLKGAAALPAFSIRPEDLAEGAADPVAGGRAPALSADELAPSYPSLTIPLAILAGEGDKIIDWREQSLRLHRDVPSSIFRPFENIGHMLRNIRLDEVIAAVEWIAEQASR